MNLLEIVKIPVSNINPQKFKDFFYERAQDLYMKKTTNELHPFSGMLTMSGEVFLIFPDFANYHKKDESMDQIRFLAKISGCIAYGFVSEAYIKGYDMNKEEDKRDLKFLDNINYHVSMLSDRKEVLLTYTEIKLGTTIAKTQAFWEILRNGKKVKLSKMTLCEADVLSGRMVNIL